MPRQPYSEPPVASKVRLALQTGDHEAAKEMLPPEVYKWCVNHGPWQCVA